jgi:hypothetical protein
MLTAAKLNKGRLTSIMPLYVQVTLITHTGVAFHRIAIYIEKALNKHSAWPRSGETNESKLWKNST